MEPTLLICGRYIDSESSTLYDKYINKTNTCNLHGFIFCIINQHQFDNPTIILFIEKIAKMKKICPNFLTSCKQLMSSQKPILTNCIGTMLLKLTVSWLESNIDYENVSPELFATDMFGICNDMCRHDYDVFSNMTVLIKKINLLIYNCGCKYIMTLSQKMYEYAPVYSKLNLVHNILSKVDFTDHTINIDNVVKSAFFEVSGEFYKPRILNIKLSDVSRNLRTKINEILLGTNSFNGQVVITNENDVVAHKELFVHKSDMKHDTITKIDYNNSVCMICDSIIRKRPMYGLEIVQMYGYDIAIKKHKSYNAMCNIFCDVLLEYVLNELIYPKYYNSGHDILIVRNIRSKLFLLYGIKIQINFCSDILKHISLFFFATMKQSKS